MSEAPNHESMRDKPGVMGVFARYPKMSIAMSVLLVATLGVLGLHEKATRSLACRIAAIRAKGEPTTVEDLIARQPRIPDEENMSVALAPHAQALTNLRFPDELVPLIGTARLGISGEPMPPLQLGASEQFLAQIGNQREGIRKALKLHSGYMAFKWSRPIFWAHLPALSEYRAACKVVNLEALVHANRGDADKAAETLIDAMSISTALNNSEFLIGGLSQMGIDGQGMDCIERSVNLCQFSEPALAKLQGAVKKRECAVNLRSMFETERVSFLDTYDWVRSKGGSAAALGAGSMPAQIWQHVPLIPALDAGKGLDLLTQIIDAVRKPNLSTIKRLQALEPKAANLPVYCFLSRLLIPSLSRCAVLWVRSIGQNRALQAALAAERYRINSGKWPESLNTLVPQYLDVVPLDPSDDNPIRYARIPEGIKTWTISDEQDNKDDGGNILRLEKQNAFKKPTDFGWVILNPELRGKMPTSQPAASK